jgi:hypothetical protein
MYAICVLDGKGNDACTKRKTELVGGMFLGEKLITVSVGTLSIDDLTQRASGSHDLMALLIFLVVIDCVLQNP